MIAHLRAPRRTRIRSAHWEGNWEAACNDFQTTYRTYPDRSLVVASSPFVNTWGLKMVLVAVVPPSDYPGQIDATLKATVRSVDNRSAQTTALIAAMQADTAGALAVNRDVQVRC